MATRWDCYTALCRWLKTYHASRPGRWIWRTWEDNEPSNDDPPPGSLSDGVWCRLTPMGGNWLRLYADAYETPIPIRVELAVGGHSARPLFAAWDAILCGLYSGEPADVAARTAAFAAAGIADVVVVRACEGLDPAQHRLAGPGLLYSGQGLIEIRTASELHDS